MPNLEKNYIVFPPAGQGYKKYNSTKYNYAEGAR